jgi:hypothetical protein
MFILLISCLPKKISPAPQISQVQEVETPSPEIEPPPFSGQVQTKTLLTVGILDPIPTEIKLNTSFLVQFRSLYPNGCWSQSEVTHQVSEQQITHEYTTTLAEDRMCTMALIPGGFQTDLMLDSPGEYSGQILINGEVTTTYSITAVQE